MRGNRIAGSLLVATCTALPADVSAHRFDEYLHAARIAVESDRVRLDLSLTPGIAIADVVVREIDRNGDGVLSREEQEAYATRILGVMALHMDGDAAPLQLKADAWRFPDLAAMRNGDGAIAIESHALLPRLPAGSHHLVFRNRHAAAHDVYLANALVPETDRIAVTGQRRDGHQRELTIDFIVRGAGYASGGWWVWAGVAGVLGVWFVRRQPAGGSPLER